ncbi:MAG: hypothetical protein L6Q77_11270 [Bacteroidetes bacterium]|nr:hypothetical protein [Bacteroidota bacterium]
MKKFINITLLTVAVVAVSSMFDFSTKANALVDCAKYCSGATNVCGVVINGVMCPGHAIN